MPPTFEKLLAELIKRAASPDDPIRCEFHDGDAAHLGRWLDSGRANEIWERICSGPFNSGDAFEFVLTVLSFRRMAEEADVLNKDIPSLERHVKRLGPEVWKRAVKKLTKNEMTPQRFTALNQQIEEILRRTPIRDPLLSVRSDKKGTRQRTLFCRLLSDVIHHATGKWHDAEVQAMCEITSDWDDDVTVDVRSARRESTRKRRR